MTARTTVCASMESIVVTYDGARTMNAMVSSRGHVMDMTITCKDKTIHVDFECNPRHFDFNGYDAEFWKWVEIQCNRVDACALTPAQKESVKQLVRNELSHVTRCMHTI